jgi:hypothetical protein
MNYCKTCRYWKSPWAGQPGLGACDRIEADESGNAITDRAEIRWMVLDDSGISVTLVTMASFACVLHAPHKVKRVEKFEYR